MKKIILIISLLCFLPLPPSTRGNICLGQQEKPYCLDSVDVSRLIEKLYRLELLEVTDSLKQVRLNAKDSVIYRQETIIANNSRQVFVLEDVIAGLKLQREKLERNQLKWWHYGGAVGLVAYAVYITYRFLAK